MQRPSPTLAPEPLVRRRAPSRADWRVIPPGLGALRARASGWLALALGAALAAGCVPLTDEDLPTDPLLVDADADGYTREDGDCDDGASDIHPGAVEVCDGEDNDCSGAADDAFDTDHDGYSSCELAGGFTDCDDDNDQAYPGAPEVCDGVDNNCNDQIDERLDKDNDGYSGCEYASQPDCDDDNKAIHPGASESCDGVDNDCDDATDEDFDEDGDGWVSCQLGSTPADCDDEDKQTFPGRAEACDAKDNDCDGGIDETFDVDEDGYYSCASLTPGGEAIPKDCDDGEADVHPGATEVCDGVDNDCDTKIDDADSSVTGRSTFYTDADGDTFGDLSSPVLACTKPAGAVVDASDCDDHDAEVNPQTVWYKDGDGDGYGSGTGKQQCTSPGATWVVRGGDCSDSSPGVNPGAAELCNDLDEDCDARIDEGLVGVDGDNDQYDACAEGGVTIDCDDQDVRVHPTAEELCDDVDNDCDATLDEGFDLDHDGFSTCEFVSAEVDCDDLDASVNPNATEICDGADDDCSGGDGDLYVHPDPLSGADFRTLQAAIDGAPARCVVQVAAGTYLERINFKGKALTLVSEDGAADTIIDGDRGLEEPGVTVTFDSGEGATSILQGFTITGNNGVTSEADTPVVGAGIYLGAGTAPRILDNHIVDNTADYGAGVYCGGCGAAVLRGNTFEGNIAYEYILLQVHYNGFGAGIYAEDGRLSLQDNAFVGNVAQTYGGGVYIDGGSFSSLGDRFTSNAAVQGGGAAVVGATATLTGDRFELNTARGIEGTGFSVDLATGRGAALLTSGGTVDIRTTLFEGNRTTRGPNGKGSGGAWRAMGGTVTVAQSVFLQNTTSDGGGAVYVDNATFSIANNLFAYNTAAGGGAILVEKSTSMAIGYNTFYQNDSATSTGTLYVTATNGPITGNLIVGDQSNFGYYYNPTSASGGDAVPQAPAQITYNDLFGNSAGAWGGSSANLTGTQGNIAGDPLFQSPQGLDFHLKAGSPAIDAGDPAASDGDGSRADLGMFGGPGGGWDPSDAGL